MNRILPGQVLSAYEKTGLVPSRDTFVGYVNGSRCACGLSAVYADRYENGWSLLNILARPIRKIESGLDLDLRYLRGFTSGFDGVEVVRDVRDGISTEAWQGHQDGEAAWEAVKHLVVEDL